MPMLSTGYIIVGVYATKVRRTLYAQLSQRVRSDKEWAQRVAYGAAQLNRVLYELFVNRLKLDKGDVIRVRINYDIDDEKKSIIWRWNSMRVEVFRRVPGTDVELAVKEIMASAEEILKTSLRFEAVKLGETEDGDVVYALKLGGREVGAVIVTPLDGEVLLKSGAVLEPSPAIFGRTRAKLEGRSIEEVIAGLVSRPQEASQVERNEALKLVNSLRSRVGLGQITPEEEEEDTE